MEQERADGGPDKVKELADRVARTPEMAELLDNLCALGFSSRAGKAKVKDGAVKPPRSGACLESLRKQGKQVLRLLSGPAATKVQGVIWTTLGLDAAFRKIFTPTNQLLVVLILELAAHINSGFYGPVSPVFEVVSRSHASIRSTKSTRCGRTPSRSAHRTQPRQ